MLHLNLIINLVLRRNAWIDQFQVGSIRFSYLFKFDIKTKAGVEKKKRFEKVLYGPNIF